jgi:hypothetical protein
MLESWKVGRLKNVGRLEGWKVGRLLIDDYTRQIKTLRIFAFFLCAALKPV